MSAAFLTFFRLKEAQNPQNQDLMYYLALYDTDNECPVASIYLENH